VETPFLHGQYEVSVDSKNRMLIPAEIRRQIDAEQHGKDFFLVIGQNKRPWLYSDLYYRSLTQSFKPGLFPSAAEMEFFRYSLSCSQQVELDGQGRILIPVRSIAWMGLEQTKKFYLIGVFDHLEVWEVGDWENERKALRERGPEIFRSARQETQQQQASA